MEEESVDDSLESTVSLSQDVGLYELHAHSDCAHSPESLYLRAGDVFGVDSVEELAGLVQPPRGCDWDTWYNCLKQVRRAYTSPEVIGLLAEDVLREADRDGVDVYEFRVSLISIVDVLLRNMGVNNPGSDEYWRMAVKVIDQILNALDRANKELEMQTDLVMSVSCSDKSLAYVGGLMRLTSDYKDHIMGVDLTNERDNSPSVFAGHVESVRGDIPGLTVHCMEIKGPERGWDVLALNPDRIGHGIRASEDPALMNEFAKRGVPFEICPHSNVVTGAVSSLEVHPMRELHDAGVPLVVCSDGTNDGVTLLDNYQMVSGMGFSPMEIAEMRANAVRFAFRNMCVG